MINPSAKTKSPQGFTLIEVVAGIVVLAIAMLVLTSALGPLYQRSSDPWHQVRAAELGQSFLNEIMARSFDENSDRAGGEFRCYVDIDDEIEPGALPCTASSNFGVDSGETDRTSFDDVDDYHEYGADGSIIADVGETALADSYSSYQVNVTVAFDGNRNGVGNEVDTDESKAKLITVIVTTPSGERIPFSAYRGNW